MTGARYAGTSLSNSLSDQRAEQCAPLLRRYYMYETANVLNEAEEAALWIEELDLVMSKDGAWHIYALKEV